MISTLVLAVACGAVHVDPVDFRLGWKQGETYTYVHHIKWPFTKLDASGDVVVTVATVSNAGFTVTTSPIQYTTHGERGMKPATGGVARLTKHGRLAEGSPVNPAHAIFLFAALPEQPVSVGDAFTISMKLPDSATIEFQGKFLSLGGPNKNLAKLEMGGTVMKGGRKAMKVKVTSTFDIDRGVYVSIDRDTQDGFMTESVTLKESVKTT